MNNNKVTASEYTYPSKTKFYKDCTASPPPPVDATLLDCDVLALMKAAYPDTDLKEIGEEIPEIMETFWMDIEHGKKVMEKDENYESPASDSSDGN